MSMPPDVGMEEDILQYATEVRNRDGTKVYHDPVFVLRAQDKLAPGIIDAWANRLVEEERREYAVSRKYMAADSFRPSWKVREARAIAHEMRAWQERNTSKVPD